MLLLEFDLNVLRVEQTPVHIPYRDAAGNSHTYEPPLLVTYRRDIIPAKWMPPLLCDVMTRREALRSLPGLIHRLRAARAYALRRGWEFRLLTEREIRTPYLFNAKFLLRSRSQESNPEHARLLCGTLYELRLADVETLLLACSVNGRGCGDSSPAKRSART
jgi:hypothetical protein